MPSNSRKTFWPSAPAGSLKCFAVPADAHHLLALVAAAVADVGAVGVRLVPGVRQADAAQAESSNAGWSAPAASPKANFQPGLKL
jgi:hypothetical protein